MNKSISEWFTSTRNEEMDAIEKLAFRLHFASATYIDRTYIPRTFPFLNVFCHKYWS